MSMSFSAVFATRTASTALLGTRGFFGSTRSIQTHTKPLSLLPLRTEKPKWSVPSLVSGSDRAMRRTSAWVAISLALRAVEELAGRVGVAGVPRGLVDQVQQHP